MFLKRVPKNIAEMCFPSFLLSQGLTAYYKMNDDNTIAQDSDGNALVTAMTKEEVNKALASGEFSKVED